MHQKGSRRSEGSIRQQEEFKVVIVGDDGCGKTSLLMVYTKGEFPEKYVPSAFEKCVASVRYRGEQFLLNLYDTAGQEAYDRLRPLSYQNANLVIICYDVMCPSSFDNVLTKARPDHIHMTFRALLKVKDFTMEQNFACKGDNDIKLSYWYPEVHHFCRGVPIILVGCKADLRKDKILARKLWSSGQNAITYIQGEDTKRKINAELYLECSAKYRENVEDIFREATKLALATTRTSEKNEQSSCALL